MNSESPIVRRHTRKIYVGDVPVGGDAPISVQSMTNTETCDVAATVAQVRAIADAGADIVRISVPSMEAAEAFRQIRAQVTVPLVADIHFDHKIALIYQVLGSQLLPFRKVFPSPQVFLRCLAQALSPFHRSFKGALHLIHIDLHSLAVT